MIRGLAALLCLALGGAAVPARAASYTFVLPDIGVYDAGTAAPATAVDTGQTFAGDGFVGLYAAGIYGYPAFASLFGVEQNDFSRTIAQIGIAVLDGMQVLGATLGFYLETREPFGGAGLHGVEITGYAGSGALGYAWNAPDDNYGSVNAWVDLGSNSVDVTALVAAAVSHGDAWLNLHLRGSDELYLYTRTEDDRDAADLRLFVIAEPLVVPVPSAWAGFAGALLALAGARRRAAA